ncbi:MAG: DNA adenine methylase [Betaproteobacteria bacterium]
MSEQLELPVAVSQDQLRARSPVFRPIHYLGSKLRLVEPIRHLINALDEKKGAVCDLFAGSGTVAMALAEEREVLAVDVQEYSRVLCSAILRPRPIKEAVARIAEAVQTSTLRSTLIDVIQPLMAYEQFAIKEAIRGNPEVLCDLLESGSVLISQQESRPTSAPELQRALRKVAIGLQTAHLLESPSSMVLRHFGGIYFSYQQAAMMDLILDGIHNEQLGLRDNLLAPLLSTASDVVNTVGKHFAQPIRPRSKKGLPKRHLLRKIEEDRAIDVWSTYVSWLDRYARPSESGRDHEAIRADYRDALRALPQSVSIVYADPPYTRDHYSRFYHVLETFCFRDDPAVSSVVLSGQRTISRGLYRESRHQSPFCIKSQAPGAFEALFKAVRERGLPLVVSYSPFAESSRARPRLMSVEQIKNLAASYYSSVEVASAGRIAHSKLNASELNTDINYDAEILLTCRP